VRASGLVTQSCQLARPRCRMDTPGATAGVVVMDEQQPPRGSGTHENPDGHLVCTPGTGSSDVHPHLVSPRRCVRSTVTSDGEMVAASGYRIGVSPGDTAMGGQSREQAPHTPRPAGCLRASLTTPRIVGSDSRWTPERPAHRG